MKKWKIFFLILTLSLIVFYLLYLLWNHGNYATISPHKGAAVRAVYATGEVEPVYWSELSAMQSGRVSEIPVDDGDEVKEDQVLLHLDDDVEQAQLKKLEASLKYLASEIKRKEELSRSDFASIRDYEKTRSDLLEVEAQIEAQKALLSRMDIISPIDGIILKRDVELGETINQGKAVFWVGKLKPLRVTAEVDEEDIAFIKPGQKALLKADAFPEQFEEGEIVEITPKGDPINKNFRVRISVHDDTKFLIGMTVEVNVIVAEEKNALLVPVSSVIGNKVLVEKNGKIEERNIEKGIIGEKYIQVKNGLKEDEEILLNPAEYTDKK